MTSVYVHVNSVEKVKEFVKQINHFPGDFDLCAENTLLDAKSILGIYTLDIGKPMRLDIHDDAVAPDVINALGKFLVDPQTI